MRPYKIASGIVAVAMALGVAACGEDLAGLNDNPNAPDDVSAELILPQAIQSAVDLVYNGVIEDTRKCIEETEELDPVTNDMLIGHTAELEKFQWFVRAHLENAGGKLSHAGARTEKQAAAKSR